MAIAVDNIVDFPDKIVDSLKEYKEVFQKEYYIDNITAHRWAIEIEKELNEYCLVHGIIGYHYTRANKEDIETYGLKLMSGVDRRSWFLETYNNLFTKEQIDRIKSAWLEYFDKFQNNVRDCRIWFNLTNNGLNNGGADYLLSFFGGESIYMPLKGYSDIAEILKSIGCPLIVRCKLNAKELKTFTSHPFGKVWLSTYHRSINPDAEVFDIDTYLQVAVKPGDIISLTEQ